MCGYSSQRLRGVSPHSLFYSHCNTISSICRKVVCHPFHWSPDNNFGINHMYFKVHFLNQCCATKLIQKNRTKVTIANSKVKHKYERIMGRIRNLVLDFILYFVTLRVQHKIQYTSLEEVSRKSFYGKQLTTVTTHKKCSKLLQWNK